MEIQKQKQERAYAIRFSATEDGQEIGRAYLYVIFNELHKEPVGLMEDVFVEEEWRGKGVGTMLVEAVIAQAKAEGCYKLIGQSRYARPQVHALYKKHGFEDYGKNFRMDLLV